MLRRLSPSAPGGLVALLVLVVLGGLTGCESTEEKPPEPTELASIGKPAFEAKIGWSRSASSGSRGVSRGFRIAAANGRLYVADAKGNVAAHRSDNGERLWRRSVKQRIAAGPGISGDLLTLGTLDGELVALARADGAERWVAPLSGEVLTGASGDGRTTIARSLDGRIYGFSINGTRQWAVERSVPTLTLRGTALPLVENERAYLGLDSGRLLCVDLTSGKTLWETPVSLPKGRSELERIVDVDAEPLLADDRLYAVSYGGDLVAMNPITGEIQWKQTAASATGLASDGAQVYVSDNDGRVLALDAATGAIKWKQEALLYRPLSRPAVHGGFVVVGDFEGYVHWLSPRDGKIVARERPFRQAIIAPPFVEEKRLFVLGDDGTLAAIDLPAAPVVKNKK